MAKALTREDLLYILQSVFRLSEQENNAFKILDDGLYAESYQVHAADKNLHVNETLKEILNGFSVTKTGMLLHNNVPVSIVVSKKEGNGISIEMDGLYVPSITQEAINHIADRDIHVTSNDKINWNSTLDKAKEFTLEELNKLTIYDVQIVEALPEWPLSTTLYLLANDSNSPEGCLFSMYMFLQDQWVRLSLSQKVLDKYALKTEVKDAIDKVHEHKSLEALNRFDTNENGELLYNGTNIHEVDLSTKDKNAAKMIDGKLYVEDLKDEIKALEISAAFAKVNLYDKEISDSGVYKLKDSIDNYNLILVEYYYKPNDETHLPGCAKTAVIDTDVLNYLYSKNIDYMLEYGYGILTSNSKIRMHDEKLWVDYYHNVCIYRVTGIRRGDDNE